MKTYPRHEQVDDSRFEDIAEWYPIEETKESL